VFIFLTRLFVLNAIFKNSAKINDVIIITSKI